MGAQAIHDARVDLNASYVRVDGQVDLLGSIQLLDDGVGGNYFLLNLFYVQNRGFLSRGNIVAQITVSQISLLTKISHVFILH